MTVKYRVHEVAKDLNAQNKDIINLLKKYFDTVKKHQTVLTNDELDVIFEYYTSQNQAESFDEYFSMPKLFPWENKSSEKVKEDRVSESVAVQPAKNPDKSIAAKKESTNNGSIKKDGAKSAKDDSIKDDDIKKDGVKDDSIKEDGVKKDNVKIDVGKNTDIKNNDIKNNSAKKSADNSFKDKPANNQKLSPSSIKNDTTDHKTQTDDRHGGSPDHNKENNNRHQAKAKKQAPRMQTQKNFFTNKSTDARNITENISPKTDSNIHRVDTRSASVELDKYNERYEQIAPQGRFNNYNKDNITKKQKLTQRSAKKDRQQYSKKETEAQKLQRLALERARKQQLKVLIPDEIVVSEFAARLKTNVGEVIKKLMTLGVMANMNEVIDFDTASLVAEEFGAKVEKEVIVTIEERLFDEKNDVDENLEERSPIVVVMGHVDHGKTSLLDKIRDADVTSTEAGGITQHIGAYKVGVGEKEITFLDTPGHEAFTSMRARGASITDIAILVVAADDGIMPQTVEAINHAKAADVSIIVAINKIDKPSANAEKVKQELSQYELIPEEWGGDIPCIPVSAVTGEGIQDLLEMVVLIAEMKELKANPNRLAKGTVVEARLDKGRGPIATLLVQNGTLRMGDTIIAGSTVGHIRSMYNDKGQPVKEALPATPVEIAGLSDVPSAGDIFNAVENERLAKELVNKRKHEEKQEQFRAYQKVTLDNLFKQIEQGEMKELAIIVKADVHGSVEAIKQSLEKLSNEEVRVKVIHGAVGAVSKSDIMLANASNAIIIGFNVRPDPIAQQNAEEDGVDLRLYRVIYDAIEEVEQAMKGMLAPKSREVQLGRVEVRQVYKISNIGTVAGCYVLEGKVVRNALVRIVRDGIVVAEDQMDSLKRFKDDAKEVMHGYECGITLQKYGDIKTGDIFESFIIEEYRD